MRKAVKEMGIPLESAVKCATANPTKAIGIYDKYGSLTVGKQADVVLLDEDLEIKYIIKAGEVVYGND
jgi:N-acetylglucosamine-6-phosphate deacetylase